MSLFLKQSSEFTENMTKEKDPKEFLRKSCTHIYPTEHSLSG
jgi:hypothetical protein